MKDFKKFMKEFKYDKQFVISHESKRNTLKVVHVASGEMYSCHPADQAVRPLSNWIKKHKKEE